MRRPSEAIEGTSACPATGVLHEIGRKSSKRQAFGLEYCSVVHLIENTKLSDSKITSTQSRHQIHSITDTVNPRINDREVYFKFRRRREQGAGEGGGAYSREFLLREARSSPRSNPLPFRRPL